MDDVPEGEALTASEHEAAAYRPAAAARRMGISRTKLYEELAAGRITARKVGTATLVTAVEIERWLAQLPRWEPSCEP